MNENLTPHLARQIIEKVESGNPPEYGFQYFTAGLDAYLNTLEEEYLKTFIKDGGSTFKMVVGPYGTGKTHFLYSIRELAWKYNYVVSYITLSVESTPFHKLEQVYREIVVNLGTPPLEKHYFEGYEKGIDVLIKNWYHNKYNDFFSKLKTREDTLEELARYVDELGTYESTSFKNAIRHAFLNLAKDNEENFSLILQWLKAENPPKNALKEFRIYDKVDKGTAFRMIRSLVQWIRDIGYSGIVVLMDEAEITPSLSSKEKNVLLNNLRSLIDECGHTTFRNSMWIYAVPDETFLEGRSQIYEALRQRLAVVFEGDLNPSGVKIYLEDISPDTIALLREIGEKLAQIYEVAYQFNFDKEILEPSIESIAQDAYKNRFSVGYKRVFVQNVIKAFHLIRKKGVVVAPEDLSRHSR